MKVLFVNKFGPAANAITGKTANELATFLLERDIKVEFLSIKSTYRGQVHSQSVELPYSEIKINNLYNGDKSALRLVISLVDGFRLFLKSYLLKKDVIIVMTEPPLLFMWFQLFRWTYKARLVYWSMDVYPEAFISGKLVRTSNLFYKLFQKIVYHKPPDLLIALGDAQKKFLENKFGHLLQSVIFPCGIRPLREIKSSLPPKDKIVFGYSGNLGSAHDPEFLLELIDQLDPDKHHLILSLYGTKASFIRDKIKDSEKISYRTSLSFEDIANLDINIASLLPEWNHVCVPSKAVTAICSGSTLLLNSNTLTDNWLMLEQAAWRIDPSKNYRDQISKFLSSLNANEIHARRAQAYILSHQLNLLKEKAFHRIETFIKNPVNRSVA